MSGWFHMTHSKKYKKHLKIHLQMPQRIAGNGPSTVLATYAPGWINFYSWINRDLWKELGQIAKIMV